MKHLIKTFKNIAILCFAITFLGCEEEDAVLPQVKAGFTYTLNIETGTVTFINISTEATKYTWDFGDGTGSSLINPVKIYAENNTYTVKLTASNVAGASDTFEDQITILFPEIATLPISFDGENTKYEPEVFNGASFEIVDNPDTSGTNTEASKVGAITNSGATFEGIAFELGTPIDLTTDKTIKMDFWSDTPIDVLLKLEISPTDFVELPVSHGGTGWEELLFNFSGSSTYPKLVLFVDGPGTSSGTFYIDNIEQIETDISGGACTDVAVAATMFPVDFEACESFIDSFTDVGSIKTELSGNPDNTGINTSASVLKVVKASGTNKWAGVQNAFPDNFDATKTLKLKVYSTKANVVIKFEANSNPQPGGSGNPGPQYATITDSNTWTEVEITFTGIPDTNTGLNQLVIKPDNADGTDGEITDSEETYYFDDLTLNEAGSGGGGGGTFDDGLLTNGDFENGSDSWIGDAANVQEDGGNSYNFANVETAGNAFSVNLSQVVEITQGATYRLSFDASSIP